MKTFYAGIKTMVVGACLVTVMALAGTPGVMVRSHRVVGGTPVVNDECIETICKR